MCKIAAFTAVLLALGIGVFEAVSTTIKVRFSQEQASAKMREAIDKKAHEGLLVERPVLTFNNNAVQFSGRVSGTRLGQPFSADVSVDGVPHYDERSQAVFFTPTTFSLKNFSFRGEAPAEKARRLGGTIFKNTTVGTVLDNSAESIEQWVTKTAEQRIRTVLEKRPVYRLKDDVTGIVLKASLTHIAIEEHHVVATLSVVKFSLHLVLLIGSIILGALLIAGVAAS
jgi:ribosomal protein L13E